MRNTFSFSKYLLVPLLLLTQICANNSNESVRTSSIAPLYILTESDTILSSPEFSEEIISHAIDSILSSLINQNYPFAKISPTIVHSDTSLITLKIDSGVFVDSLSYELLCEEPIKPWLLSIPVGPKIPYQIESILDISERVSSLEYVNAVSVGAPQMVGRRDTSSIVVPLFVQTKRSFLFDGSIVWSSENGGGIVGYLDATLTNSFWLGESIEFNFYGDDHIQKASLETSFPFLFKLPLTFDFWGDIEVGRDEYGYLEAGLAAKYAIQNRWSAGLGGKYYEVTEDDDTRKYGGVILSLQKSRDDFSRGKFQWGMLLLAESGVRSDTTTTLPQGDVSTELSFQWPLSQRLAIGANLFTAAIASTELNKLHSIEKHRVGGAHSLRGYSENQFAFVGTSILQSEFRFFFSDTGMLFSFIDAGAGVKTKFTRDDITSLMGYGAGIRIPTGRVIFSLVWARHRNDISNAGRVHVGIGN